MIHVQQCSQVNKETIVHAISESTTYACNDVVFTTESDETVATLISKQRTAADCGKGSLYCKAIIKRPFDSGPHDLQTYFKNLGSEGGAHIGKPGIIYNYLDEENFGFVYHM